MKKFFVYISLVYSVLFCACSKEIDDNTGGGNTGGGEAQQPTVSVSLSPDNHKTIAGSETFNIDVTTDAKKWTAYSTNDWINVTADIAASVITVTVSPNYSTEARFGAVTFQSGKTTKDVQITQEGTNGEKSYYQDYFTIDGINPSYTLYSDHGIVVYPAQESVTDLPGGKGFDGHKRVNLIISYRDVNICLQESSVSIKDANIESGSFMDEKAPITYAEAAEMNCLVEDSLFIVETLFYITQYGVKVTPWVGAQHYLNIPCYAGYAMTGGRGVNPTFNLAYDPDTFKENEAEVTFLYNRHCPKTSSSVYYQSFESSFPMAGILRQVPGRDSVVVTINARGKDPVKIKMARE